jgi:NADH:ubiquinone oxidoreductase subunit 6 (subunit J)
MNMKEKEQDLGIINYFIIYSTTFKLFLVSTESKNFLLYKIKNTFFNLKSLDDLGVRLYDTDVTDLYLIGWLFYEKFYIIFIFIGIILFAAMLAIILLIKPFLPQALSFKKC